MDENGVQLVCFTICGQQFAFNMDDLVEIVQVRHTEITPFFSPVPIVRGKWEYRGKLVYIIDVRDFFDLEDHASIQQKSFEHEAVAAPASKNVLVIRIGEQVFGLLTDTVSQMQPLKGFYEYPTMVSTLPRRYFAGLTIVNADLVLLLAIENFINENELESLLSLEREPEEAAAPTQAEK